MSNAIPSTGLNLTHANAITINPTHNPNMNETRPTAEPINPPRIGT